MFSIFRRSSVNAHHRDSLPKGRQAVAAESASQPPAAGAEPAANHKLNGSNSPPALGMGGVSQPRKVTNLLSQNTGLVDASLNAGLPAAAPGLRVVAPVPVYEPSELPKPPGINKPVAPLKIGIMNGKGGSGKSTIATNLASVLSTYANSVTIVDNDPQGSSSRWLKERPDSAIPIKGTHVYSVGYLRNMRIWQESISRDTKYVVVDTQAGLKDLELSAMIERCDMIIIPVLPSAIDMRATADFISQIFMSSAYRKHRKPIGVVANRVIHDSLVYRKLQRFLLSLKMNFISTFNDNKVYLISAEQGVGIFETKESSSEREELEWGLLTNWIRDYEAKLASARVAV